VVILGNEKADAAAKSALSLPITRMYMTSGINIYSFFSDIQKIILDIRKKIVISEILAH